MKVISSIVVFGMMAVSCVTSGTALQQGEIIPLYEEDAPGYKSGVNVSEVCIADKVLFNVQNPTLQVFPAENPNGTAALVVPGGGFYILSYEGEGVAVAKELNKRGITAFVLKYRLNPVLKEDGSQAGNLSELMGSIQNTIFDGLAVVDTLQEDYTARTSYKALNTEYSHLAFEDADNAMRYIRAHAKEYGIKNLGMVGFSAGAMITMNQTLNHMEDSRPDFAGVIYGGWYEPFKAPSDAMPLFLCSPVKDVFAAEESWWVYNAWRSSGTPTELHTFSKSEHGFGAESQDASVDGWIDLFCNFLKDCNLIK